MKKTTFEESDFQTEWTRSVKKFFPKAHYYKIPDPTAQTLPDGRKYVKTTKRPYDCFAVIDGKYFAFELKVIKKCESLKFNIFQEHQIDNLMEVHRNGQYGFAVVNYRFCPTRKQATKYGIGVREHNFCFMVEINNFIGIQKELNKQKLNYIPFEFLISCYNGKSPIVGVIETIHPKRNENGIWDIDYFLKKYII